MEKIQGTFLGNRNLRQEMVFEMSGGGEVNTANSYLRALYSCSIEPPTSEDKNLK